LFIKFLENAPKFKGKGQIISVDHINRIGSDNRSENLRIVDQTTQNINRDQRKRDGTTKRKPELFSRHEDRYFIIAVISHVIPIDRDAPNAEIIFRSNNIHSIFFYCDVLWR